MHSRPALLTISAVALLAALPPLGALAADKGDKDGKKWLDEVAPLILQDEQKTYQGLKDKADRDEFQKIFWARRNPLGAAVPDNSVKTEFEAFEAEANKRFTVMGKPGTSTDCARVLYLLGQPDDIKPAEGGASDRFQTAGGLGRPPEQWTYKNRPGMTFSESDSKGGGGQMTLVFDERCQLPPQAGQFLEQLNKVAQGKIVNQDVVYRMEGGHLVKLADLLPKASAVQALLKEPRQDFPLASETKLVMRTPQGTTYIGGLVRGEAAGLDAQESAGKKRVAIAIGAQALDESGKVVFSAPERETSVEVGSDGAFLGSYGLPLKPGKYTVKVGAMDVKTKKGSVATMPIEIPDFSTGDFKVSDPLVLSDVQEKATVDPKDPLAAFFLGTAQIVPRYGNVFSQSETVQVLAFVYNPQTDPATGKPSVAARFSIQKDGKTVSATDEDQVFDTPVATPGIGPVPLAKFAPGKYTIQIKVTDKVAKKDVVKEAVFEVKS
jgi:GWxTD domain-containing protein